MNLILSFFDKVNERILNYVSTHKMYNYIVERIYFSTVP